MNGNYYINKWIIKLKKPQNVRLTVAAILFAINFDISIRFFMKFYGMPFGDDSLNILFGQDGISVLFGQKYLLIWIFVYYIAAMFACNGYGNFVYEFFIKKTEFVKKSVDERNVMAPPFPYNQDKLQLIIGLIHNETKLDLIESPKWVIVPEKGLFQDFMISGGKGTGKTQSCMYPFTKQMMYYKAYSPNEKAGMLILDVKGNYTKAALEMATEVNRESDVIVMNLSGKYRYNPLHKENLRPQVIANRLRTVLELFSTQHGDSYWLDKAEVLLTQSIKLVRLYNKGYVTFAEIHKVVNIDDYLNEKIEHLQELEDRNKLDRDQKANFRTVKDYFLNEYRTLDTKISSVIKSEVTRMTQTFIDDPDILKTFCAPKEKLNFFGFDDLIDTGKIVVLDMNIAEFRNLSKIIAAYLKLDFQSAALIRLTREGANTERPLVFVIDEYQEYVTANDADFYAVSREAKCINIVATQSYSSLLRTLKNQEVMHTILTNLTNKIWLRTDDKKTAEVAVSQCGTIKKKEVSYNLGKGGGKKEYSHLLGQSISKGGTTYNESYAMSVKSSNKFEIESFTIELKTFKGITYLSDGDSIMSPSMVHLEPYFQDVYKNLSKRVKPALKNTRNSIRSASLRNPESEETIQDNYNFETDSTKDEDTFSGFEDTSNENSESTFQFDGFDDSDKSNNNTESSIDFDSDDNTDFEFEKSDIFDNSDLPILEPVIPAINNPEIASSNNDLESFDDISDDDYGFGDYKPKPKDKKKQTSEGSSDGSSGFTPKYLDKETEKELEEIEGVFDVE